MTKSDTFEPHWEREREKFFARLDYSKVSTPAFVIEEQLLRHNLSVLKYVKDKTGAKMFQALKTWATWELFPVCREYLDGTEVSSLNEARLGYEEFNHNVHIYAPAYKDEEFADIMEYCSTIIFNSFEQWKKFKPRILAYTKKTGKKLDCGLRINPEYPRGTSSSLWSPTAPGSRLGIRLTEFKQALSDDPRVLEGISGLHFHVFWDETFPQLKKAVAAVEKKFGAYFSQMKWVNFGGGQMITNDDYNVAGLIALINAFQKKHGVAVHLEPGAAIVKYAGTLVATVLDILERDDVPYKIAILDISFNAHTPDFLLSPDLDMPVRSATIERNEKKLKNIKNTYRLGGGTCVTGDSLSHFHVFKKPLNPGDKIVIEDGIQYNMVQCTMFNGVQHPSIIVWRDGRPKTLRTFTYQDFKSRMG